jgi:hypothetical protein
VPSSPCERTLALTHTPSVSDGSHAWLSGAVSRLILKERVCQRDLFARRLRGSIAILVY